jgi:hypothetical protein
MVAHVAPFSSIDSESNNAIKLLDLLTNRYHVGIVRESSDAGLDVELPASSHLHAGQRVRFIVAGSQPLVSRHAMHRAFITEVSPSSPLSSRLNVRLARLPETAVA